MAAVMILMPKMIKCIMDGLLPISERAKELMHKHFGEDADFYIGLDPAILLGDPEVVTAGIIFIPITLLLAVIMPGNRILPFGDLATIGFFIAMAVAVHKGNLFRTLFSGGAIMYMTIWISNQTIPWMTKLAKITGSTDGSSMVAALDQGGNPITYVFTQIFVKENISGALMIAGIYIACLVFTVFWTRKEKRIPLHWRKTHKGDGSMGDLSLEKVSETYLDVLKEIGNIGAGNAMTALSQMLNCKVDMKVPQVKLLDFNEVGALMGGEEQVMVGVFLGVEGDITGSMMFLVEQGSAKHLLHKIMGDMVQQEGFSEIEFSAMQEIGNIITGAYLNSLSMLTNLTIIPTPPSLTLDMAGAILSVPAIEFGTLGDKILLIQSQFYDEVEIDGYFILVPDIESYPKILKSLGIPVA